MMIFYISLIYILSIELHRFVKHKYQHDVFKKLNDPICAEYFYVHLVTKSQNGWLDKGENNITSLQPKKGVTA